MNSFSMIINGEDQSGILHEIKCPYHDSVVGQVHFARPEQVDAAIAATTAAGPAMAALSIAQRVTTLQHMAHRLLERQEEIARIISAEAGKPIRYAKAEAARAAETFIAAAAECTHLGGEQVSIDAVSAGTGRYGLVRRFPVGPVAAISPFNFPLNLAAHKIAPAIAAGCPVVLKPASQTPMSALILGQLAREAGLPAGGLNVVPASRDAANPLTTDERLKLLTFTGSAEVGWSMKQRAGKKRVVLELGGNAAALVGPDAPLAQVIPKLVAGSFAYAGQVCISVQRIFVLEPSGPMFLEQIVEATRSLATVGNPADPEVMVGPMIDRANQERIMAWIAEARAAGARVLCGGEVEGPCVQPTVLTEVDPRLPICAEEAFAPIVVVERVSSWTEAIERTNNSRFGLQCGVFTNDLAALWRCFDAIEVGGIIHNDCPTFRVDHMPYGGVKDSGLGREGPRYALEEMTERRLLVLKPSL